MEEAEEVCDASTPKDIAWEVADLLFFAMTKCVANGVSLAEVEAQLDRRARKISRRKGDAKPKWSQQNAVASESTVVEKAKETGDAPVQKTLPPAAEETKIKMRAYTAKTLSPTERKALLSRPIQKTDQIMPIVQDIINNVRSRGDPALLEYTAKFEKAKLSSPVLRAPFPPELMDLPEKTKRAIDTAFENIRTFHAAQMDSPKHVETMAGITCSRFARPIERVGLYVPGGTAVLPSTAMMLGVPALVAGCKSIQFATPPRADGSVVPEIVYIASKVGAKAIVLAGGAQAVAALAYGTESVEKVDKIFGPGNQFVTAAKMAVQSDSSALAGVDLPAGPSEVLVNIIPFVVLTRRLLRIQQQIQNSWPRIYYHKRNTAQIQWSCSSPWTCRLPNSRMWKMRSIDKRRYSLGETSLSRPWRIVMLSTLIT
jgi:phosphoribosyl-ATP pyrophosphohydrolase/phosphoribosyl-AMP cyclohydrolase/histidinol dehydrogenase